MRVWVGAVGAVVIAVLAGGAVGYAVAGGPATQAGTYSPAPIRARPTLPVNSPSPYAPDVDYPALASDLHYVRQVIGPPGARWSFEVPKGWQSQPSTTLDSRAWRPVDEPPGGYQVRVEPLLDRFTVQQQLDWQVRHMPKGSVEQTTDSTAWFDYRDPDTNRHRYNFFTWLPQPGSDLVGLEISVAGRAADVDGLNALMQRVRSSARPVVHQPSSGPPSPSLSESVTPPTSLSPSASDSPTDPTS